MTHTEIVNFIWGVADLIRDTFKRGKYQDVILPLTVLRRLDCVLAPTKRKVLEANAKLKGKLQNLDPQLRKASGFAFYNTSLYDFEKLLADAPNLAANLRNYINGFSPNMREVIDKFEFDGTISRLHEAGLLFKVLERFKNVDLHPACKSDLFMKDPSGHDADNIAFGSTLSNDRHTGRRFDYLIANPPYGKDWKRDEEAVTAEAERGDAGRFGAGLPRISDGQLLFLQHMLSHVQSSDDEGSRVAIIMNGSPLFTGDAGGGESEIHRWILENDWLEALVALPEQLFYNTGIATYVWVLTNRKAPARRGKVLLVDATSFWVPMRNSLGDKRREVPPERAAEIVRLLRDYREGEFCKILPTTHFGYRKITVERPLRLNFQASPERIARLDGEPGFQKLAESESKKKNPKERAAEQAKGRAEQGRIRDLLATLPATLHKRREVFLKDLKTAARTADLKLPAPILKAILSALSERDETTEICRDADGRPEPDPELRLCAGDDPSDEESVPASVKAFFDREVAPHVPDAWINTAIRDHKDRLVGKIGYEINFTRYFYEYTPPRPLEEIEADIRLLEKDILKMLRDVTGGSQA